MRLQGKILTAVAAGMLLTGCVVDRYDRGDVVQTGDSLPEFSVTMSDGTVVGTGDLAGSVSLIMFFDVECGDCRQVIPIVNRLYLEYGVNASGLTGSDSSGDSEAGGDSDTVSTEQVKFVLIGREQDPDAVARYWADYGYSVPYSPQTDRTVYNLFATNIVPRIYVSDPALTVRYTFDDDPDPTYQDLLSALSALLAE